MADEPIEPLRWCFEELLLATVVETATGPKKLGACTADDVVYIVAELIASAASPGDASEFAQDSCRPRRRPPHQRQPHRGQPQGANLAGAHLVGANLTKANLFGANLFKADLTEANVTGANLASAMNLQRK